MSSSTGVDCLRGIIVNFLSPTGLSGGLDLIKSRMMSWASFFTMGAMRPSTITLFNLYLLERISSINISYGVSSYSIGVLVYSIFFSLRPLRS